MNYTNLFPAFEGPGQKELHTKGTECVCRPFYKVEDREGDMLTHVKHRPLAEENQTPEKRPTWLPEEGDPEWQIAGDVIEAEVIKAI